MRDKTFKVRFSYLEVQPRQECVYLNIINYDFRRMTSIPNRMRFNHVAALFRALKVYVRDLILWLSENTGYLNDNELEEATNISKRWPNITLDEIIRLLYIANAIYKRKGREIPVARPELVQN